MLNNLDSVRSFVPEKFDGDTFLYTELLDRGRKSGNNKARLVDTFYHRDWEELVSQMPTIIARCEATLSRAYIRLSPRSFKTVGQTFIKMGVDQAFSDNWEGMRHLYKRACGISRPVRKFWIYDIDTKDKETLDRVEVGLGDNFVKFIPSRAGYHAISLPHDRSKDPFNCFEVHKDNPTNLYIPEGAR